MSKINQKVRIILVAVSVFCFSGAFVSNVIFSKNSNQIPGSFEYSAELNSVDNLFNQSNSQFSGVQSSRSQFNYKVIDADSKTLQLKNTFDVETLSGVQIVHIERDYAIDRLSAQHVKRAGIKERQGYLFAPKNLRAGQDYSYWHVNYNKQLDMQYQDTESILGVKVLRYYSEFDVDQTDELGSLPDVPEKLGVKVHVRLTTWVEPVTGRLVNYSDVAEATYYDIKTHVEVSPWNHFSNTFTQPSIEKQIDLAKQTLNKIQFYSISLPIVLLLTGVIFLIISQLSLKALSNTLPYFVLICGLLATLLVAASSANDVAFQKQLETDRATSNLQGVALERMKIYNDNLFAAQGVMSANVSVSKNEWGIFANNLNLPNRLPGVQGLGFIKKIGGPDSVAAFEKSQQVLLSDPSFHVWPGISDNANYAVLYLEPLDTRNKRAIGYNLAQEPIRKRAAETARDSGNTVVTDSIELVQEDGVDKQKGFLMLLPQYLSGAPARNSAERKAALTGFVYSPFRAKDFMDSVVNETGHDLRFKLYSRSLDAENKIYENMSDVPRSAKAVSTSEINIFNAKWIFEFFPSPAMTNKVDQETPYIIIALGLVLTALATGISVLVRSIDKRASKLAEQRTTALRQSEKTSRQATLTSHEAERKLEASQDDLLKQNTLLEKSKLAMFNILEDLADEKKKLGEIIAKDEALLKGIGDGLIATDYSGAIVLTNPAFEMLVGWKQSEVVGKRITDVIPLLDETGKVVEESHRLVTQVLGGHSIAKLNTPQVTYFKRKDGTTFPVSINLSPITLDKKVVGVVEVFRDITHEKEIDRAKSEFVSLASHQLRTPLTAINWYTDMLQAGDAGDLNEEQKKYIAEVQGGSKRMVDLVNALLNVSRIDLGTFMIEPEPTDLIALCKKIVQDSEPRIFERKQKFDEDYPKTLKPLNIDPRLTRMVIENLVSNAIKYTPEGGSISLRITKPDSTIKISVTDTGYGIPAAQQAKIFTKLFRADNVMAHDTEGTGLGLYIARSVVEASGGKIWFESVENKGTTFNVELPEDGMKAHSGSRRLD